MCSAHTKGFKGKVYYCLHLTSKCKSGSVAE